MTPPQRTVSIGPRGAVVLVWLVVSIVVSFPYVLAHYLPPEGRAFQGFFYFTDDQQVYLSSSQQAEDGAFLFRNKLVSEPHEPALINLEWWLSGVLSRALGRRPFLAYYLLGLAAAFFFFQILARWLRGAGLAPEHLVPALLLIASGGGFGGLLYASGRLPIHRALDLSTGLFPHVGLLGNPHFTIGTTLFLASLLSLAKTSFRGQAAGVLLAFALALIRPYNFVLLVGLRCAFVALRYPIREWFARLVNLAFLLPAVYLNYWMFYENPAFSFYAKTRYEFPAGLDVALAMLPAVLASASMLRAPSPDDSAWSVRLQLLLWVAFGLVVLVFRPVYFSMQFLMAIGLPFLLFAALGLSRIGPRALWLAIPCLATTPIVALHLLLQPLPNWYPMRERVDVAYALRPLCRPLDLLFGPQDIGLLVGTLTHCQGYLSHEIQQRFPERLAETQRFYGAADPGERAALLDAHCIRLLILPGDDGDAATRWLPPDTPFRQAFAVGKGLRAISVYSRPSACGR